MSVTHAAHLTGRKTLLAALVGLVLIVGSLTSIAPAAHAGEPMAVFYGYVLPESTAGALPKRVRAISAQGAVCGSADVTVTGNTKIGFYAMPVVPASVKDGCPVSGETVRFALVYGLIDESESFGLPGVFRSGEPIEHHLYRVASNVSSVASPTLLP